MTSATRIVQDRHQELLRASESVFDEGGEQERRYRQVGQKYRTVPSAQGPLLAFLIVLTNGNTLEIKYAYITERIFIRSDVKEQRNVILIRVRDAMQIKIVGYNLANLNEDLLRQVVLDAGAVSELEAAAALKADRSTTVISKIQIEYGRMDMDNGTWMTGGGAWSDIEQRWIPSVSPP